MSTTHAAKASLAALGLIAFFSPSMDAGAAPTAGVTCEIRMVKRGGDVELQGILHAAKATSGSYSLKISNAGDGGSSSINQGGDFDLAAGESEVVGAASFSDANGLRARLSVLTGNGSTSCSR